MKCEKCNSEWNFGVKFNYCPFCGAVIETTPVQEPLQISVCLICGTEFPVGAVCPVCGFDQSCDVETFETICAVLPSGIKTHTQQKQEYESAKARMDMKMKHKSLYRRVVPEDSYDKGRKKEGEGFIFHRISWK